MNIDNVLLDAYIQEYKPITSRLEEANLIIRDMDHTDSIKYLKICIARAFLLRGKENKVEINLSSISHIKYGGELFNWLHEKLVMKNNFNGNITMLSSHKIISIVITW